MKSIRHFALFTLLAAAMTSVAAGADVLMAQAMLVAASDKPGKTDRRLAPYEPNLKAVLRFKSYQLEGDASAQILVQTRQTLNLGGGHKVEIEPLRLAGDRVKARIKWTFGDKTLANTVMVLRRGTPAVLGGVSRGEGEVLGVLVLLV